MEEINVFSGLSNEDLWQVFSELDKKRDEAKVVFEKYKEAVAEMHRRKSNNFHWQDRDGTVFQLAISEGRWVAFEPLVVNRTRRNGEVKGSLSEKAAKELGYEVKK